MPRKNRKKKSKSSSISSASIGISSNDDFVCPVSESSSTSTVVPTSTNSTSSSSSSSTSRRGRAPSARVTTNRRRTKRAAKGLGEPFSPPGRIALPRQEEISLSEEPVVSSADRRKLVSEAASAASLNPSVLVSVAAARAADAEITVDSVLSPRDMMKDAECGDKAFSQLSAEPSLEESEEEEDPCAICLDDMRDADPAKLYSLKQCRHQFHSRCVARWLSEHDTCPICKDVVQFDQLDPENDVVARRRERRQAQLPALAPDTIRSRARRFGFVLGHAVAICSAIVVMPFLIASLAGSAAFSTFFFSPLVPGTGSELTSTPSPTPPPTFSPTPIPIFGYDDDDDGSFDGGPVVVRGRARWGDGSGLYLSRGCSEIANWALIGVAALIILISWTILKAYRAYRVPLADSDDWLDAHDRSSGRRCCRIWNCFTMFLVVFVAVLSTTCHDSTVRVAGYGQGVVLLAQYLCVGPLLFFIGLRWFQKGLIAEIESEVEQLDFSSSESESSDVSE